MSNEFIEQYDNKENWYILAVAILLGVNRDVAAEKFNYDPPNSDVTRAAARESKKNRGKIIFEMWQEGSDMHKISTVLGISLSSCYAYFSAYKRRHNIDIGRKSLEDQRCAQMDKLRSEGWKGKDIAKMFGLKLNSYYSLISKYHRRQQQTEEQA